MEKRLFIFVVLSIVIWGGYLGLQLYLSPPKPQDVAAQQDKKLKDGKEADEVENKQADPQELAAEKEREDIADERSAVSDAERQYITLGSLDPASGYTMLVTLDNRGAAIHRIELNDSFHDLDDLSGYFGHLALTDAEGNKGAKINVVGAGTPAALAQGGDGSTGLRADDVITSVDGIAVANVADFEQYLEKNTKPEQELKVTVLRMSGSESKEIPFTATLIRRPLELIRPESNAGATAVDGGAISPVGPPSYRMTLQQIGDAKIPLRQDEIAKLPSLLNSNWVVSTNSKSGEVTFTAKLTPEQLEKVGADTALTLTKTYRLANKNDKDSPDPYHLDFNIKIANTGEKPAKVAYRLEGPNGLPLEGWWYSNKVHPEMWAAAGARDVAVYTDGHHLVGNPKLISQAAANLKEGNPARLNLLTGTNDDPQLGYVGVDTQYFASALVPGDVFSAEPGTISTFPVDSAFAEPLNLIKDKKWAKTTNASFFIDSRSETIEPGNSLESKYLIFAGPKDPVVLEPYQLSQLIEYGWFGWVSKTLRGVLNALWYVTRNYGISIILLTVMVRLALLPFSIRQAKSAALMQQLQPEIVKLKEKYKDDMEKQAIAQRELFAKHGFNPMGGCLLMFAQLPIFIGLYRTLATDIDLREAALIPGIHWASNLAGPDQLFRWKEFMWPTISDEAHGWLGPYFNVLPLVTVALFMVQQKLFAPPAITEEQKMQQNVMNFMTIFMGIMFYKVPAGLCIYFITSSLWGICERKLLPKPKPGEKLLPPTTPEKKAEKKESKAALAINGLLGMADAQLKESKNIPSSRKKQKKG